jgi:hypothetical protein
MANFNKERWGMVAAGNQLSRNMIKVTLITLIIPDDP